MAPQLRPADVTGGPGAFDEALKNLQNVCELYPPGGKYVPKPIIEARAEYLWAAERHFKAKGIKATNNGVSLEI